MIRLGRSGPLLPAIGLGCMGLGGRYDRDTSNDANSQKLIEAAYGLGVRFFDTAEVYGAGHGEEILGQACRGLGRDVFISTKFSAQNAGAQDVVRACEASLVRLQRDHIDLYQCHWPNPDVAFEETLFALDKLRKDGKISHVGFSNVTAAQLKQLLTLAPPEMEIVSVQQDYSLIERFCEHKILPYCQAQAVTMIAYSPLGQGHVNVSAQRGEILNDLASKYGVSVQAIMLAWVISANNTMAIPMTGNVEHLQSNMNALDVSLSTDERQSLSDCFPIKVEEIDTDRIEVLTSHTGKAFMSRKEAEENILGLSPSPLKLAEELKSGEMLKPVKVRAHKNKRGYFQLYEGQLRYWGWVLAHDGKKPITALVEEKDI